MVHADTAFHLHALTPPATLKPAHSVVGTAAAILLSYALIGCTAARAEPPAPPTEIAILGEGAHAARRQLGGPPLAAVPGAGKTPVTTRKCTHGSMWGRQFFNH